MRGAPIVRVVWVVLGWLVLLAPSLVPGGRDVGVLAGASRAAVALAAWAALASLPSGGRGPRSTRVAFLAASPPALALALRLDLAAGITVGDLVHTTAAVVLVALPWVVAALVADRSGPRSATVYGAFWTALVAGAPMLALAVASADPRAPAPDPWLARLGPVGLAWERVRAHDVEGTPWAALAASLVVLVAVGLLRGSPGGGE